MSGYIWVVVIGHAAKIFRRWIFVSLYIGYSMGNDYF